nr:hypothetical protein [uncultured Desulfobacter sp.]
MFKKILKGLAIGGTVLAMGATAQAADTININIYGASAQYKFWTAEAPEFLKNKLGCSTSDIYSAKSKANKYVRDGVEYDISRDAGVSVCAGGAIAGTSITGGSGSSVFNGDTVVVRYTSKASYDGIRAVMGQATDPDTDGCYAEAGAYGYRLQANLDGAGLVAYGGTPGALDTLSCQDVTIGASDVAAKTFNQTTSGMKYGNSTDATNVAYSNSVVYGTNLDDPEEKGFTASRPIVVPFAFFAGTGVPYTNMTREMAVSLFSGNVAEWGMFDGSYDPNDESTYNTVVLCMRHAGSGTLATLDAAVMRGDQGLAQTEKTYDDDDVMWGVSPAVYFNDGSSQLIECIQQAHADGYAAVGYADADKCGTDGTSKTNVFRMTWQGEDGYAAKIKYGVYDFWSAQWMYYNETGDTLTAVNHLINFASDAANMLPSKATFWAAQGDMQVSKGTDYTYPVMNYTAE